MQADRSVVLRCTVTSKLWRNWMRKALDNPGSYPYAASARVVGEALAAEDVPKLLAQVDRERKAVLKPHPATPNPATSGYADGRALGRAIGRSRGRHIAVTRATVMRQRPGAVRSRLVRAVYTSGRELHAPGSRGSSTSPARLVRRLHVDLCRQRSSLCPGMN